MATKSRKQPQREPPPDATPDPIEPSPFSREQLLAAEYSAAGWTDIKIAEHLGISNGTISRWRNHLPGWAALERHALDEFVAHQRRRLRAHSGRAVDTVLNVMDGTTTIMDRDGNPVEVKADPQHRLAAAKTVLDRAGVTEIKGVEVTGKDGGPLHVVTAEVTSIPDADLDALADQPLPGDS